MALTRDLQRKPHASGDERQSTDTFGPTMPKHTFMCQVPNGTHMCQRVLVHKLFSLFILGGGKDEEPALALEYPMKAQ